MSMFDNGDGILEIAVLCNDFGKYYFDSFLGQSVYLNK